MIGGDCGPGCRIAADRKVCGAGEFSNQVGYGGLTTPNGGNGYSGFHGTGGTNGQGGTGGGLGGIGPLRRQRR
jgi:hypothetical protein